MKNIRIVIVTGLSGSGKSTVLRALEDIGFFCVDNLPVSLLPKLLDLQLERADEISRIALVMDVREKHFLDRYGEIFSGLKSRGYLIEILFLEAADETLLHRFSETRRSHPLSDRRTVSESIHLEREKLRDLKAMADMVVDTSLYNVHQLKSLIQRYYSSPSEGKNLIVNLISFGYRYGLPPDADIVLDARFLPNPYFVPGLKEFDGNNPKIVDWVMGWEESRKFLDEIFALMAFLTPLYEKEGKAYLTIALGCTGGNHRSVVMVNALGRFFSERNYRVNLHHRDIQRT